MIRISIVLLPVRLPVAGSMGPYITSIARSFSDPRTVSNTEANRCWNIWLTRSCWPRMNRLRSSGLRLVMSIWSGEIGVSGSGGWQITS